MVHYITLSSLIDPLSLSSPLDQPKLISSTSIGEDGGRFFYDLLSDSNDQPSMESSGDGMIRPTRMAAFVFKIMFKDKTHFVSKVRRERC